MLSLLLASLAHGNFEGDGPPPRPNIVLVLADDLGLGDLGAYNPDSKIPTPNLDALAREGLRLTDCHSPSAVCTPTRYGILTGRYAWRTRLKSGVLWGNSTNLIDLERVTLPEALRAEGYTTACVGKWHLGLGSGEQTDWQAPLRPGPLDHGFDTFFGIPASLDMHPYVYVVDDGVEAPADSSVEGSAHRRQGGGGFWRAGPASEGFRHVEVLPRTVERAIGFIEAGAADGRPFFLYMPLSAPHTPWLPTAEFAGASEAGYYGDFVAQVDGAVGRVVAALERLELTDDTLVLVTSDNGSHWPVGDVERYGHAANLGYRGQKADIHEGGHRVPFLARWPAVVPAGVARDDLACLTDVYATCLGLLEAELPLGWAEDSFDLSPVLTGARLEQPIRAEVINHSLDGLFAVRRGPWKLIEGLGSGGFTAPKQVTPDPGGPAGQLYNLAVDPDESDNLWQAEPELVADLTARLEALRSAPGTRPGLETEGDAPSEAPSDPDQRR